MESFMYQKKSVVARRQGREFPPQKKTQEKQSDKQTRKNIHPTTIRMIHKKPWIAYWSSDPKNAYNKYIRFCSWLEMTLDGMPLRNA